MSDQFKIPQLDIPVIQVSKEQDKIIFGNYSDKKLNGPCRILYYDKTIVEGDFKNSYCKNAIEYQPNGGFIIGEWNNNYFQGQAKIYNFQGQLKFEGTYFFKQNKRQRQGKQYNPDKNNYSQGVWIQNVKNGQFQQCIEQGQYKFTIKGNYKDGNKVGKWVQVNPLPKNKQQQQKSNQMISRILGGDMDQIKNYDIISRINSEIYCKKMSNQFGQNVQSGIKRHNYIISGQQLQRLKNKNDQKMLDTSIISIWAAQLQHFLYKNQKPDLRIQIFGTDLLQNYAGTNLNFTNYQNVKHMLVSFRRKFGLFSGFYQFIMFPVILKFHFILGVIRVKKINGRIKLQYACYDSFQRQHYNLFQVLKTFINDQLKNKGLNSKQMMSSLQNIQLISGMSNSRQKDGSSCGIFVCKFMFDLSKIKSIQDLQYGQQELDLIKFRYRMYQILKFDQDPYKLQNIQKIKLIKSGTKTKQEENIELEEQQIGIITLPTNSNLLESSGLAYSQNQLHVGEEHKVSTPHASSLKSGLRFSNQS